MAHRPMFQAGKLKAVKPGEAKPLRASARMGTFKGGSYLDTFFSEKNLSEREYEVKSSDGTPNFIPSSMVIAQIKRTSGNERKQIEDVIRKIDFANGDVHHFLEHLAGAMAISFSANTFKAASDVHKQPVGTQVIYVTSLGDREVGTVEGYDGDEVTIRKAGQWQKSDTVSVTNVLGVQPSGMKANAGEMDYAARKLDEWATEKIAAIRNWRKAGGSGQGGASNIRALMTMLRKVLQNPEAHESTKTKIYDFYNDAPEGHNPANDSGRSGFKAAEWGVRGGGPDRAPGGGLPDGYANRQTKRAAGNVQGYKYSVVMDGYHLESASVMKDGKVVYSHNYMSKPDVANSMPDGVLQDILVDAQRHAMKAADPGDAKGYADDPGVGPMHPDKPVRGGDQYMRDMEESFDDYLDDRAEGLKASNTWGEGDKKGKLIDAMDRPGVCPHCRAEGKADAHRKLKKCPMPGMKASQLRAGPTVCNFKAASIKEKTRATNGQFAPSRKDETLKASGGSDLWDSILAQGRMIAVGTAGAATEFYVYNGSVYGLPGTGNTMMKSPVNMGSESDFREKVAAGRIRARITE